MHPDKSSLSIRLTEPVVPLRTTPPGRASRRHDGEMLPPAVVRGLLTLKLAKPTKVSSIELKLQAKAITRYVQSNSRVDVTEQYKVHSASMVAFEAGPVSQERRRATSARPRVQFFSDHVRPSARHVGSGHWQAPTDSSSVTRSASSDPLSPRLRRRLSSEDLEIDDDRSLQRSQMLIDPAPPYPSPIGQPDSFLSVDSNIPGRSQSVPGSSRITEPQSSPTLSRSSLTSNIPYGSRSSSAQSIRNIALSRTSSIEEDPEDESESSGTSPTRPDNIAYYGLSRIATDSSGRSSEQDHRGRSHSRFSFGNVAHIFETVKDRVRSRSPRAGSQPRSGEQEERGRSMMKAKVQASPHGVRHVLPQIKVSEPSVADGANGESGDGWVVFPEGTYTYPIFFTIPNNSPPTTKANHGSLVWKVKAEVKRPSAFQPKMTAQKEVTVVCVPKDYNSEEVEGVDLQRSWDDQLQYRVQTAGREVPIGGKIPFQLTITPLANAKVHSIMVYLDERTEYYAQAQSRVRSDAIRRTTLLVIGRNKSDRGYNEPILPLVSDEPHPFRKSALHRFSSPGEVESEVASSLTGPGPWTIRHQLRLPGSCSVLHPSNQTKGNNVTVTHTLELVLRVEKEEGTVTTGGVRLYDIIIHIPIQVLSCHCTSEWTSLPCYDEALRPESNSPGDTSTCPCRTRRQTKARARSHAAGAPPLPLERGTSPPAVNLNPSGTLGTYTSDLLASCTHLYERLVSGLVSERGEASPPSYERFEAAYA